MIDANFQLRAIGIDFIQVIWENKERLSNGLPHLVYVAREKRPNHPLHYKAGAMNALVRIKLL